MDDPIFQVFGCILENLYNLALIYIVWGKFESLFITKTLGSLKQSENWYKNVKNKKVSDNKSINNIQEVD